MGRWNSAYLAKFLTIFRKHSRWHWFLLALTCLLISCKVLAHLKISGRALIACMLKSRGITYSENQWCWRNVGRYGRCRIAYKQTIHICLVSSDYSGIWYRNSQLRYASPVLVWILRSWDQPKKFLHNWDPAVSHYFRRLLNSSLFPWTFD